MSDTHDERISRSFDQQAATFEDARFNRVLTTESDWLFAHLDRGPDDLVLDVAAGTGHASRLLAPSVRAVVALDATAAMLTTGRTQAAREGVRNIVFQQGDAAALPFLDASFSIVVCRYAIHHFPDPVAQLREMVRCLRPKGSLAIADLVSHPDPRIAERQNALERLRDPAHARMLTQTELLDVIADAGLTTTSVESRQIERGLPPWLEQTATDAAVRTEIEHRLAIELEGGEPTGFQPKRADGTLLFTQTFTSVIATKQ